jgi:two-component system cell cycle sensor histidine kinase/response regulator CckA
VTLTLRILHLEDSDNDAELLAHHLATSELRASIHRVAGRAEFFSALSAGDFDLIISDHAIPSFSGVEALTLAQKVAPDKPFIFLSGTLGEDAAIETLRNGATDYVLKDRVQQIVPAVQRALRLADEVRKRKDAERRIHEQAALLDKAQDAIVVNDTAGHVKYWNDSAARIFGWSASEASGRDVAELLRAERPQLQEAWRRVLESDEWNGEMRLINKAGVDVLVASRWSLVRDADGQPLSVLTINTDITERKRLEVSVLRMQRMESIGVLAGGIAHDLNNALSPILAAAQLLQTDEKDPAKQRWLETIVESVLHSSTLLRQILAFARGSEARMSEFQPSHIIREVHKVLRDTIPPTITFRTDIGPEPWTIKGDSTQLNQVLMNLCLNARDAMPSGGEIVIIQENIQADADVVRPFADAKPGPYCRIIVRDSGTGIAEHHLQRIFDPFFTTKEIGKGTGLGLAMVQSIVKHHGGFIDVASQVGKGTSFSIYLPALTQPQSTETVGGVMMAPRGQGEWILVVDDEESNRSTLKASLELNGYRVITASDGAEALAVAADRRAELRAVLTDIVMPYMDGVSLIRALNRLAPSLKAIAMSGALEPDKNAQIAAMPDVPCLQKPFTTEKLLFTLADVLR